METIANKKQSTWIKRHFIAIIKCNYSTKNTSIGDIRHYPVANKEWKDSVYSYNKNYLKSLPISNSATKDLIASHFHLTNLISRARSRHMKNLIIKKTTKKIYLSKPHIKHNNDKTIVNVYAFNRQKEFLMRKLYFYRRKYNLLKKWLSSPNIKKINIREKSLKRTLKKRLISLLIRKRRKSFGKKTKKRLPYYGQIYKNELDYLKYRTSTIYRKFLFFNNIFVLLFFRGLLRRFGIKLFMPLISKYYKGMGSKNLIRIDYTNNSPQYKKKVRKLITISYTKDIINSKFNKLVWLNKELKLLSVIDSKDVDKELIKNIILKNGCSYNDIILLNKRILYYIESELINKGIMTRVEFIEMYNKFKSFNYNKFIFRIFRKKDKIKRYLSILELDNFKYTKSLSTLKALISRIFNKKTELNITNLKYPFLNSDVYTSVLLNKAVKKLPFLKVMKSSLSLSKIPKEMAYWERENLKLSNYAHINNYKRLSLNNLLLSYNYNKDKLNNLLTNIYPNFLINKKSSVSEYIKTNNNKMISILNTIKFKWVSGVWLQGAGRLGKRFTASRSVLKIRHKGSLSNKQYNLKEGKLVPASIVVLRNTVKSNSQYTFMKSKKRIGSFGIKSWISSY